MTQPSRPAPAPRAPATPPDPGGSGAERVLATLFAVVDGWGVRRDPDDRWVAGVCAGLARRWNVDPVVVRVGLVVLTMLSGIGVVAYLVAWMLVPQADGPSVAETAVARHGSSWPVVAALAAVPVLAVMVTLGSGNGVAGDFILPAWLSVVVLVGLAFYARSVRSDADRPRSGRSTTTSAPPPPSSSDERSSGREDPATPRAPTAIRPFPTSAPGAQATGAVGQFTQIPTGVEAVATPALADAPRTMPPALRSGGPATGPRPARVERRRAPRRRRAGALATLCATAAALIAYGLALLVPRQAGWEHVRPQVFAFAAALAVSALALVFVGMAGRRGGLISLLALILAVGLAISADPSSGTWRAGVGDSNWVPTATTDMAYRLGVGEATLDLSSFPQTTAGSAPTVTARLGVGELIVSIPSDLTVLVNARAGLGTIDDNGTARPASGGGGQVSLSKTYGGGPPDLVVDASVDLGQITIRKAS